jgi:FAD/FMN-containing dehydrogenase
MENLDIAARAGPVKTVPGASVEALAGGLRGALLQPGAPGYDTARNIWNGMIDRHPALIVRCAGTADVVAAVRFARTHDLLVAVKGGGHNVAGNAVCDGGLMIDLTEMRGVHVDPVARRAQAQGGATWGDFDAETQLYGLATTGGLISSTGVAGLTLGGGIGWLSKSHGLACDNLISVDLVTADGDILTASETENSELFWGLKGGGGNFGIATSFEFQLHPVGPEVFGGMVVYPLEQALDCLALFRELMAGAPDQLAGMAVMGSAPDGQKAVILFTVYNGDPKEGEALLQPMREMGAPILDTMGVMPYRVVQTLIDASVPHGRRYYFKSSFLDALPDDAIETVIEQRVKCPSPQSKIIIEFLGGAFGRVPREATVFDHRRARHNLLVIGAWEDAAADDTNRAWARETWAVMQDHASEGVYINYLGTEADEGSDRVRAALGPGKYDRLVALKTRYDPDNMFRMNQNIRPA